MDTVTHSPIGALAATPVAEPETEQPLIRLDLYPSAVRLTRYDGPAQTGQLVSPLDLAAAWSQMPVATGFLPPNTLFWQRQEGAELLAVFVPGRQWTVQADGGPLRLPLSCRASSPTTASNQAEARPLNACSQRCIVRGAGSGAPPGCRSLHPATTSAQLPPASSFRTNTAWMTQTR
jgi:hypothetical protein